MVKVRAFQGYLADKELVEQITNYPDISEDKQQAKLKASQNKFTFNRIQRPSIDFIEEVDDFDEQTYFKGKENVEQFIQNGWLKKDDKKSCYIYSQTVNNKTQYGLVLEAFIMDYMNQKIKKHESTKKKIEEEKTKFIEIQQCDSGPVILFYEDCQSIDQIVSRVVIEQKVEMEFSCSNKVLHRVWKLNEKESDQVQILFNEEVDQMYIADGHHRAASSMNLALKRMEELRMMNIEVNYEDPYLYFMAIIYPKSQLTILEYNRLIKDLNGHSAHSLLNSLQNHFNIKLIEQGHPVKPSQPRQITMFIQDQWFQLTMKSQSIQSYLEKYLVEPQHLLDVDILTNLVLVPIFNIQDQRTDNRIDFQHGIHSEQSIKLRCQQDCQVAFIMFPIKIDTLMNIADQFQTMPPKSTWFEPKPREGVIVRLFSTQLTN